MMSLSPIGIKDFSTGVVFLLFSFELRLREVFKDVQMGNMIVSRDDFGGRKSSPNPGKWQKLVALSSKSITQPLRVPAVPSVLIFP